MKKRLENQDWKKYREEMINRIFSSLFVITSIMGHSGGGFLPFMIFKKYRRLVWFVWRNKIPSIAKSSTLFKNIGNFIFRKPSTWRFVQMYGKDSMLNAYGLTNGGVLVCAILNLIMRILGFNVIPSYYIKLKGISIERAVKDTLRAVTLYVRILGRFLRVIEFNLSCPNVVGENLEANMEGDLKCISAVRKKYPWLVIIVKVGVVHTMAFVKKLEEAGADMIHGINTVPFYYMYPNAVSPLDDVGGGGLSGKIIRNIAVDYYQKLIETTNLRVIMGGGNNELTDAKELMKIKRDKDFIATCTGIRVDAGKTKEMIEHYL